MQAWTDLITKAPVSRASRSDQPLDLIGGLIGELIGA